MNPNLLHPDTKDSSTVGTRHRSGQDATDTVQHESYML